MELSIYTVWNCPLYIYQLLGYRDSISQLWVWTDCTGWSGSVQRQVTFGSNRECFTIKDMSRIYLTLYYMWHHTPVRNGPGICEINLTLNMLNFLNGIIHLPFSELSIHYHFRAIKIGFSRTKIKMKEQSSVFIKQKHIFKRC